MKLLFIRHGETTVNTMGFVHKMNDDAVLTKHGREQIESVIPICNDQLVEHIFCSPEPRAIESAHIISKEHNLPIEFLPELRERNWGAWCSKPWSDIKKLLDNKTLEDRYTFVPPEGESWKEMTERLEKAITYIVSQKYKSVAVVTHGGALRALMPMLTHQPLKTSLQYNFENAAAVLFTYKKGIFTLVGAD